MFFLPMKHCSVFKTILLLCKLLHNGYPKYLKPFLKPKHSMYNTCRSQTNGAVLAVPHCASSAYKPTNHLASALHMIWNGLLDDVRLTISLYSVRKKLKTHLFVYSP